MRLLKKKTPRKLPGLLAASLVLSLSIYSMFVVAVMELKLFVIMELCFRSQAVLYLHLKIIKN